MSVFRRRSEITPPSVPRLPDLPPPAHLLPAPPPVTAPSATWAAKQAAVAPDRFYGHEGTIHQTDCLSIEIDGRGQIVAVWFRCQMLPFEVTKVGDGRAEEMRDAYTMESLPGLTGVVLRDQVLGDGRRP